MTTPLELPVEKLLARLATNTPRWIVGMVGVPGSGKSTLARRLADEVNARAPGTFAALGMDGFHLTKAQLSQLPNPAEAFRRRGAPWTFDTDAFLTRLQLLRDAAGHAPVTWPDFQHDVGDPVADAVTVAPTTRLMLVEGLYLLHNKDGWEAVGPLLDECWYLDTPLALAMERLAQRHTKAWGITRAEADAQIAANDRLNAEIVWRSMPFADWRLTL